jgi:hypothetical protein
VVKQGVPSKFDSLGVEVSEHATTRQWLADILNFRCVVLYTS